jgi:CDP-diacylglycerol--serine O-phosphatidyltransferase
MGGRESLFGAEFDSLADVISFGMAPALLMFYLILAPTTGTYEWFRNIGWAIGFIYLLCAAMRLARFNVITNPLLRPGIKELNRDFVGLPVPAAALTVAATVLFLLKLAESDRSLKAWALMLPPLMLLVAFLMVSTVRYPSGKNVDLQTQTRVRPFILLLCGIGLVIFYKEIAMLGLCLAYIFFGLIRYARRGRPGLVSK